MSGIFGLIHLDDLPVRDQDLQAMRLAMHEWGPDGGSLWRQGPAGLGNVILFDTPEAVHEKGPLQSRQGFVLTAEARLDNRPELCAELQISQAERLTLPDSALCLRAYEEWGVRATEHLIGDWSFAAWHSETKRLFLARDHFGNTALYYYQDQRRFAFASSRKALFALGIPRRLNEFYLACGLISWTAHQGSQTIELDLRRLPPAHTLTLDEGRARLNEFWRLEDVPRLQMHDSAEYVEAFLPIYDRAVRDRLRSYRDVGVTLSGGLDSGSVSSLAARALREQGRRLKAYTSVPIYDVARTVDGDRFGNELPFAQAVASFAGNMDLVEIRTTGVTPVQAIRRGLEVHDEPGHAAGNLYWIFDLLATAGRDGLGTVLSGQGGNATISWTGLNSARQMRRLLQARQWKAALQRLVYPYIPLPLLRRLRHVLLDTRLDWSHTAIQPDFARRIRLAQQYIEGTGTITNPEVWHNPLQHRYAIIKPGSSFVGAIWAENSGAHGLDVRDPTFDTQGHGIGRWRSPIASLAWRMVVTVGSYALPCRASCRTMSA